LKREGYTKKEKGKTDLDELWVARKNECRSVPSNMGKNIQQSGQGLLERRGRNGGGGESIDCSTKGRALRQETQRPGGKFVWVGSGQSV